VTFDYVIANAETGARLVTARTTLVSLQPSGKTVALDASVRDLLERARA
jgi:acyl-CoA thioesterase FadM